MQFRGYDSAMTPKKRSAGRPTAPGTARALAMIDAGKANPHAAALACRIDPSTVYRALARRRERAALKCTAANAPAPDGQDIKNGGNNAE